MLLRKQEKMKPSLESIHFSVLLSVELNQLKGGTGFEPEPHPWVTSGSDLLEPEPHPWKTTFDAKP